jgi:anti-sigma factor RsiW
VKGSQAEFVFACPAEEISAYIDGELPADLEVALERHVGVCEICRNELNDQKGFLIALSDTLEREVEIELPIDFTKTVVANAESKVSGLRDRKERILAFSIIGLMGILAAVTVGSFSGALVPVSFALEKFGVVIGMAAQVIFDLVHSIANLLRTFIPAQTFAAVLAYITVSLAVVAILFFVSRSLRRYFHTQGSE